MNFDDCLKMLKLGNRMARRCWNGKGMFIYMIDDSAGDEDGGRVYHINLRDSQGNITLDWDVPYSDINSDDWEVVL